MCSLGVLTIVVVITSSVFLVIRGNITGLDLPPNICLCVSIRNCNVRDSACGNVITQAPDGECYIYTGQHSECMLSGNLVQFFETIFYGENGWIFGHNLNLGKGPECGISDECAQQPCQNDGRCYNTLNGVSCSCVPGYEGLNCQIDVNECQSDPCSNGARCNDLVNSFTCTCLPGYTGLTCAVDIDECQSDPCLNGAPCIDRIDEFKCTCLPGFIGTTCEVNINECQSNPCLNGATCNDLINGFKCDCASGYIGTTCARSSNTLIMRNDVGGSASQFFHRSWNDYILGFGNQSSQFWIGLDWLHDLTHNDCTVVFDIQNLTGTWYYAQYTHFKVAGPEDGYLLTIDGYSGNLGDAMAYHNGSQFSTYDHGLRQSCGANYFGGWWFDDCCLACVTLSPETNFQWIINFLNAIEVHFAC